VDSGLSMAEAQKGKSTEKNLFERIVSLNLMPAAPREVITKSDGVTIDDEAIVKNMTQFRNKTEKEGTIDVYW
jgi:hypothetical protein